MSHLLQVAGLVLEHGGTWEAAVAAVLHDVVEDTPATLDDVRARFGDRVASIVEECTDAVDLPRGPGSWRRRKELYLGHLRVASSDAALVSACDSLHNLRGRSRARADGFNATVAERTWFYREVVTLLAARDDVPAAVLAELRSLTDLDGR